MADRNYRRDAGAYEQGLVNIVGTINIHSDSTVLTTGTLKGATVTKPSGTGLYRITFTDKFYQILFVNITPLRGTFADYTVVVKSATASDGYVEFVSATGGSAADPTSCTFLVHIVAKNSSVT